MTLETTKWPSRSQPTSPECPHCWHNPQARPSPPRSLCLLGRPQSSTASSPQHHKSLPIPSLPSPHHESATHTSGSVLRDSLRLCEVVPMHRILLTSNTELFSQCLDLENLSWDLIITVVDAYGMLNEILYCIEASTLQCMRTHIGQFACAGNVDFSFQSAGMYNNSSCIHNHTHTPVCTIVMTC